MNFELSRLIRLADAVRGEMEKAVSLDKPASGSMVSRRAYEFITALKEHAASDGKAAKVGDLVGLDAIAQGIRDHPNWNGLSEDLRSAVIGYLNVRSKAANLETLLGQATDGEGQFARQGLGELERTLTGWLKERGQLIG